MTKYIIGIDEVGRGPLAGPLVVAAVAMPRGMRINNREPGTKRGLSQLKDSKKLTALQRESWERYIKNHDALRIAYARVGPKIIERMNVSRAANLAASRACKRLMTNYRLSSADYAIYLDGGLFLNGDIASNRIRTIIRGDEKINVIKMASIVAKQHRDRFMVALSKKYPGYGFEIHKGYGTKKHIAALRRIGNTPEHRLTFIRHFRYNNNRRR